MVDCPRCGHSADRLISLPADAVDERVLAERDGSDDRRGQVCQWCRHEVIEG